MERQKKNRMATKKMNFALGMLTCHADGKEYVEKRFFGCVARKLEQKTKFRPATLRIQIKY